MQSHRLLLIHRRSILNYFLYLGGCEQKLFEGSSEGSEVRVIRTESFGPSHSDRVIRTDPDFIRGESLDEGEVENRSEISEA